MFCAISGTVPDEPVINVKSGHLYERRLILKAIEQTGRDPVTDDETQPADLLAVRSAKVTKPRPVAASSVGGMLSALTNEFDALLLETNTLRNELEATRSELSQALYQHDAACRVIARVMKERDAARSALSAMQGTLAGRLGAAAAAADADVAMSAASAGGDAGSAAPSGLSDALVAAIKDKNKELTKMRKKRVVDPETAPAEGVRTLALARSFTPHAVGVPITALAATGDGSVITGGGDKVALLFDPSGAGRVTARLSPDRGGHTKRVTAVAGTSGSAVLLTGGADGAVKVWRRSSDGTGGAEAAFELSHSLQPHGQVDVVGIAAHSLHPLAVTAGRNGSWSIIDYDAGRIVTAVTDEEAGGAAVNFDSMALHPDGVLVAAGTRVATVRIFDVRTQSAVATFAEHTGGGSIGSLSFSENGYSLASAGSDGAAKIWDLRKLSVSHSLTLAPRASTAGAAPAAVTAVSFDVSGLYLAGGDAGGAVEVWGTKDWAPLAAFNDCTGPVTGVAWGPRAASLVTSSADRSLKVYELN